MGPCQCCQVRHFLLYCVGTVHPSTLPLGSFGEGTEKASLSFPTWRCGKPSLNRTGISNVIWILDEDLALVGNRSDARLARVNCKG